MIYQGKFDDAMTDVFLSLNEKNEGEGVNTEVKSKVRNKESYLLVECFQNLIRHGQTIDSLPESTPSSGIFLSRNSLNQFYITSANIVSQYDKTLLEGKLEEVNKMGKEELNEQYLKTLGEEGLSKKGGAGLGLIEMARKSGRKLVYDFQNFEKELSLFYLRILIDVEKRKMQKCIPIDKVKEIHQRLLDPNMLFLYKGDFSQPTIMPIIKMLEGNLGKAKSIKHRRLYIVIIELFQNITKHGSKNLFNNLKDGIFMIKFRSDGFEVSAGNVILSSEYEGLKKRVEVINELGSEGLNKEYRDVLRHGKISEKGGAGLGLIDIARESIGSKLEATFDEMSKDHVFYTLKVIV